MPVLPLELIRQVVEDIIDDVDDSIDFLHLSSVSLLGRLLRHEAQRVLFRDPGELHTTTAARLKTIKFMDTIASSPDRLALYVETFNITFDDWFHPNSDETVSFVQKLSNALRAMRNLQSLDISQWTSSVYSLPNILQDVHSKLTSFSWSGLEYSGDTASEAADVKIDFLRRQDEIKHLVISEFIDESTLKPVAADICPRIKSLSAPYSITEIILPGKQHITSLQWTLPLDDHTTELHHNFDADIPSNQELLLNEFGRIRYLSYNISESITPVGPNIRRIAPYLTSLVCLNTYRGTIKVCVVDIIISAETLSEIYQQVDAFSQLPCLKILVLVAGVYDDWPEQDDLIKVAVACQSLDHIDIEDDNGSFSRFRYDHSSKTLQSHVLEGSDSYTWIDDFDTFDD